MRSGIGADRTEWQRPAEAVPGLVRAAVTVRPIAEFAADGAMHNLIQSAEARRLIDRRAH